MTTTSIMRFEVLILLLYFVLNTLLNAYNKFLFAPLDKGGANFRVPLIITLTHAIAGMLTSSFLMLFPSIYKPMRLGNNLKTLASVTLVGVLFAASIGLNNMSLQYLALSMQQVIRSAGPAVVAMLSYAIERRNFDVKQVLSLVVLVGGVILTVFGDVSGSNPLGIFLCTASIGCSGLQYIFISITMNPEHRLKSWDLLLYAGPPTILVLLPSLIYQDEITVLKDYVDSYGYSLPLIYIGFGCVLAVAYNLVVYTFVSLMGPVFISVVLIILFSVLFMDEDIRLLNALGLLIAMIGFSFNAMYELQGSQKGLDTDGGDAGAPEKEKLLANEK